jgi:uncharacterized phage protein gp47/JayE
VAFTRPTLSEINARIQADIVSGFGLVSVVRRSFVAVLSRAYAGACHLMYGFIDWVSRQCFPDTAEGEHLIRWCNRFGIFQTSAVYAAGAATFTGSQNSVVAVGSKVRRSDGVLFSTATDATIGAGGSVSVAVTADEAGASGNTALGQTVTLVSPIAGVNTSATVSTAIVGGVDEETKESMRSRLIERLQNPPQGGARRDYEQWALAVAGVTRCWVFVPGESGVMPGFVKVLFATDNASGGSIPDAAAVTALQTALDAKRPATATVQVSAPIAFPVNFTMQLWPSTDEVKAAVTAELKDLLIQKGGPNGTIYLSHIHEAISSAEGEERHNLTIPSADVTVPDGKVATLGTITWLAI